MLVLCFKVVFSSFSLIEVEFCCFIVLYEDAKCCFMMYLYLYLNCADCQIVCCMFLCVCICMFQCVLLYNSFCCIFHCLCCIFHCFCLIIHVTVCHSLGYCKFHCYICVVDYFCGIML